MHREPTITSPFEILHHTSTILNIRTQSGDCTPSLMKAKTILPTNEDRGGPADSLFRGLDGDVDTQWLLRDWALDPHYPGEQTGLFIRTTSERGRAI